jgi:hypothetical protein
MAVLVNGGFRGRTVIDRITQPLLVRAIVRAYGALRIS